MGFRLSLGAAIDNSCALARGRLGERARKVCGTARMHKRATQRRSAAARRIAWWDNDLGQAADSCELRHSLCDLFQRRRAGRSRLESGLAQLDPLGGVP